MKNTNLIVARENAVLTKTELAKKVGVSVRMYQNYELNDCEPKVRTANKIACVLGTTTENIWKYEV